MIDGLQAEYSHLYGVLLARARCYRSEPEFTSNDVEPC